MPLLEGVPNPIRQRFDPMTDTTTMRSSTRSIHATADDVIEQALAYVFAKDKDFQEPIKSPEAKRYADLAHRSRACFRCGGAASKLQLAAQSQPLSPAIVAGSKA